MQIKNRNGLALWRKKKRTPAPADATASTASPASAAPAETAAESASELEKLYSAILDREGFTYDAASDPTYRQYREAYTAAGKRAMADAEAEAAALTGGYGSTYSAAVGGQEYDEYMKKLAAVIPELRSAAYDRYKAEGDALAQRYAIAKAADEEAYSREQDAYERARAEEALAYSRAEAERERAEAEAKAEYTRQKDERTMLTALIGKGYDPTDTELTAAGMTRAQANSLLYEYYRASKQTAPTWLTDALGIAPAAPAAASSGGSSTLKKVKTMAKEMRDAGADAETVNTYISRQATAGLISVADARKLMTIGNR